jgi:hypothetical protein
VNRDVEPLRDFLVAQAVTKKLDDLALPGGEPYRLDRPGPAAADRTPYDLIEQRVRQLRGQHLYAPRDLTNRSEKLLERGILHHEAGGARAYIVGHVVANRQEPHDDHLRRGYLRMDCRGQAQAVVVGEPEIDKDDIRTGVPHLLQGLIDIRGGSQDLEIRLRSDHRDDPLPQQAVVVNEHQRDGCPGRLDGGGRTRFARRFPAHGETAGARLRDPDGQA